MRPCTYIDRDRDRCGAVTAVMRSCGHFGQAWEYIVCGVLGGRSILPHVRHSNWRRAASKVVGVGSFVGRLVVAGSYGTGYYMHTLVCNGGLAGTRNSCSLCFK